MEYKMEYIFISLVLLGIILFCIFIYYIFSCYKSKIPISSSFPFIFDMVFKIIQVVFIICIVFYSDVIMSYSESMKMNKKQTYYKSMAYFSIENMSSLQVELYFNELKKYIRQDLLKIIVESLIKTENTRITYMYLPSEYKILHDSASYFFKKKLPKNIPEDISNKISIHLLQILSREGLSQSLIQEQSSEEYINIIKTIKENKIKLTNIIEIENFMDKLNDIVDNKIYTIDDIISAYFPEINSEVEEYIQKIIEDNIKKEMSSIE